MYKVGSIILAIWVALTVISLGSTLYSYQPILDGLSKGFSESAEYISFNDSGSNFDYKYNYNDGNSYKNYNNQNEQKTDEIMTRNLEECLPEFISRIPFLIVGLVFSLALLALYILSAVYANSLYKKHTLKNIIMLKSQRPDLNSFELSLRGGTATGLAIATGIIITITEMLVGCIWAFNLFSNIFSPFFK